MYQFLKGVGQENLEHFRVNPLDHIRLVFSIARKYLGRGFDYEDLISYGIIGLLRACRGFDQKRGIKFSTYGTYWIREEIQRGFKNDLIFIRVPSCQYLKKNKIDHGELSLDTMTKIEKECILAAREIWRTSFYGITQEGEKQENEHYCSEGALPDYEEQEFREYEENCEFLREELTKLEAREQRIISLLFIQGLSINRVCKVVGLTKDTVRKIRNQSLRKLRDSLCAMEV